MVTGVGILIIFCISIFYVFHAKYVKFYLLKGTSNIWNDNVGIFFKIHGTKSGV